MWPSKPQFLGVRGAAANIGHSCEEYTEAMFQEDFPQFFAPGTETEDGEKIPGASLVPVGVLAEFLHQASASIQPDKWLDGWRYACGLYVAHQATLYLRTYTESSSTPAQAAATGALVGVLRSAKLGQDSVTYSRTSMM